LVEVEEVRLDYRGEGLVHLLLIALGLYLWRRRRFVLIIEVKG